MTQIQVFIIAVLQGTTELFPVSSLGHAVVLPALLGWDLDQRGSAFLPFLVMLHVGTATALLAYFWRDWLGLARGVLGFGEPTRTRGSRRLLLLIIVATLPAVVIGFAFEHALRGLFGSPVVAATFLAVNGLMLFFGERLRAHSHEPRPMSSMSIIDALVIGLWQCTALIPGISRSGATIVGGLLRGIDHEDSARFSFLIATPIILGATVLEVPKLLHAAVPTGTGGLAAAAAVVAGLTALLSTSVLMRYFRRHDDWALKPFAYYCLLVGGGSLAYLAAK